MDVQAIAAQVADAIKEAPEKAQDFVSNPKAAVEGVVGKVEGIDLTEVFQAVMAKLAELKVDLSHIDLSKIDLSAIDVSKLDLGSLADKAKELGVDVSKLAKGGLGDLEGIAGNITGALGGLFGKK